MFVLPDSTEIVALALAEDLGVDPSAFAPGAADPGLLLRDVTGASVVPEDARFAGRIVAREACVVAGLPLAAEVFETLSAAAGLFEPIELFPLVAEGAHVAPGTPVAEVEGVARAVLAAERTALDLLMTLSGIATETAAWVGAARGAFAVCDTRKTWPGLRELSKYAVAVGGGSNHRHGLFDMVLVKDNHIRAAGGIGAAVASAREFAPTLLIEVEADTAEQALAAVSAGADLVLLDNMDAAMLATVVPACRAAAESRGREIWLEASGGITRDRLGELVSSGVDRVSTSALTLARPADFGLDEA